jgi:hypothetical protein
MWLAQIFYHVPLISNSKRIENDEQQVLNNLELFQIIFVFPSFDFSNLEQYLTERKKNIFGPKKSSLVRIKPSGDVHTHRLFWFDII